MKSFRLAICFGLVCAIMLSMSRFDTLCDELRNNVFRLHILANSDSGEDQVLKLKVRDAVLNLSEDCFKNCSDSAQAINCAEMNIDKFKTAALNVIKENGYNYDVQIDIEPSYFENRRYDSFMLPAGEYMALNIKIGEAKGKNWWCVMFPQVCIGASKGIESGVSKESAELANKPDNYELRFKTVEIYEDIKKYFKKF